MNLRNARILALVFGLGILAAAPASGQVARSSSVVSMKDALKQMLQDHGAASLKKVTVTVDAAQAGPLTQSYGIDPAGQYTVYQGIGADKTTVTGTVVVVNEEGKEGPLQALVAFNPAGQIYDIGFTVFGEDKGKGALNWNFLKQFIDKKPGDPFVLGNDVDGISGATWTSTSVVSATEKAAIVFAEFMK